VIPGGWRNRFWPGAVTGLALLAAVCGPASSGGQADGHSAAPLAPALPAHPAPLGEARLDSPKLVVRLTEVTRTASDGLTVSFDVSNPDPISPVSLGATFAASPSDTGSLADTYLFDEAHQKKYFVMRDDRGRAACSQDVGTLPAGHERKVWCRFPGPPDSVARISIGVPRLPMFRAVAISAPAEGQGRR
jgi:hypothetical protein